MNFIIIHDKSFVKKMKTFFEFDGGLIGVIKKIKLCLVVSIDLVGAETFSLQQRGYRFLR